MRWGHEKTPESFLPRVWGLARSALLRRKVEFAGASRAPLEFGDRLDLAPFAVECLGEHTADSGFRADEESTLFEVAHYVLHGHAVFLPLVEGHHVPSVCLALGLAGEGLAVELARCHGFRVNNGVEVGKDGKDGHDEFTHREGIAYVLRAGCAEGVIACLQGFGVPQSLTEILRTLFHLILTFLAFC